MAVRWPGGSVTGSLLREPVAATPTEPEPETTPDEPVKVPSDKKGGGH